MATRRTALALIPALAIGLPGVSSGAPRQAGRERLVPPIIRISAPDHFDWGDAGVGAAAGFGLAMVALGAGSLLRGPRLDPREDQ